MSINLFVLDFHIHRRTSADLASSEHLRCVDSRSPFFSIGWISYVVNRL
jgi:hypothetical protein